jgi:hypothetical protein
LAATLKLFAQIRGWLLRTLRGQPREIAGLGAQHMLDDPVKVAAAAARPFAQFLAGRCAHGRVECVPIRLQQLLEPLQVGVADRPCIARRGNVGRAEIGGRVALQSLDHGQRGDVGGRLKRNVCSMKDAGVTWP